MSTASHQFHQLVQRSGLLTEVELRSLPANAPTSYFLDHQLLTHYQLQKLQQGQWQNLILAHHELLYPLARGGTSMVYLARPLHQRDAPLRALKVALARSPEHQQSAQLRLQHEGELCRRWSSHPHLANVVDSGTDRSTAYLLMEYVAGSTLRQLCHKNEPMDVRRLCRIFADVALGLQHLHQAGVIHRDVKPSNIMVDSTGRGTLIDFGYAYARDELYLKPPSSNATLTLGTLKYMAPEQIAIPYTVGPQADLYGLGCAIYMVLTGRVPFPGLTPQEIVAGHRHGTVVPIRSYRNDLPFEVEHLVVALLEKLPERRPSSAQEVASILTHHAAPIEPIQAATQTPLQLQAAQIAAVQLQWLNARESGSAG